MFDLVNGGWREYREHLRIQAKESHTPVFGTFELTPLCNFNCKMCYVHLSQDRMRELGRLRTADEWVDMARQAQDEGLAILTLTGGEIFSRPDFMEIYTRLSDLGLLLSLISNGSLIDEDVANLFVERPPLSMRVTLYGSSNDTYQKLCGESNGFNRVIRGLDLLKKASVNFSLSFTATSVNIGDLKEVGEIAETYGVRLRAGVELVPGVRGAVNKAEELRASPRGKALYKGMTPDQLKSVEKLDAGEFERDAFRLCKGSRCSFWIDWNGGMNPCAFMSSCESKPFDVGFRDAWNEMLKKMNDLRPPQPCLSCECNHICYACPGIREAETGSPSLVCEEICQNVRQAYFEASNAGGNS